MASSPDAERRAAQLANLRPAPPAPEGNDRNRRHGGYAEVAAERIKGREAVIVEALAADAPVRDRDGGLPRYDHAAVGLLARAMCRLDDVSDYLQKHGLFDGKGRPRPALEIESKLRREVASLLTEMAMTPRSRAAIGVDLARQALGPVARMQGSPVDDGGER